MCSLAAQGKWTQVKINNNSRKFIYLISPNKIDNTRIFLTNLEKILNIKKFIFFN